MISFVLPVNLGGRQLETISSERLNENVRTIQSTTRHATGLCPRPGPHFVVSFYCFSIVFLMSSVPNIRTTVVFRKAAKVVMILISPRDFSFLLSLRVPDTCLPEMHKKLCQANRNNWKYIIGTSLVVQWLRICLLTCGHSGGRRGWDKWRQYLGNIYYHM